MYEVLDIPQMIDPLINRTKVIQIRYNQGSTTLTRSNLTPESIEVSEQIENRF